MRGLVAYRLLTGVRAHICYSPPACSRPRSLQLPAWGAIATMSFAKRKGAKRFSLLLLEEEEDYVQVGVQGGGVAGTALCRCACVGVFP